MASLALIGSADAVPSVLSSDVAKARHRLLTLVGWAIAIMFLMPGQLTIGGLGFAGIPSTDIAYLLGIMWVAGRVHRASVLATGPQPLRPLVALFTVATLIGFGVARARPLSFVETGGSTRILLATLAVTGLALAVADAT